MNQLAIVITAYNRAESLKNLLQSLSRLRTDQRDITLVISIDNKGTDEVNGIANEYTWNFGDKKVFIHEEKKGLVNHFIWAGDQTRDFDNVIFLEDDLLVSPCLIDSAHQIIDYYSDDEEVAAASLYNPIICELTGEKFHQVEDGYDFYFLQQPYWGNIWFKKDWEKFATYLKNYEENKKILPKSIASWEESFKKIYIQYLIENSKYVVTPRISIVTNLGIAGLHSDIGQYHAQNTLLIKKTNYRLCKLKDSNSVYDAFMEISSEILKRNNSELEKYEFIVDTRGVHQSYELPYVLTTKPVKKSIKQYSSLMKPTELSVFFNQKGNSELKFCKREDVVESRAYYFRRRYSDIKKNYWVGIQAGLCITLDTFRRLLSITWKKIFGG